MVPLRQTPPSHLNSLTCQNDRWSLMRQMIAPIWSRRATLTCPIRSITQNAHKLQGSLYGFCRCSACAYIFVWTEDGRQGTDDGEHAEPGEPSPGGADEQDRKREAEGNLQSNIPETEIWHETQRRDTVCCTQPKIFYGHETRGYCDEPDRRRFLLY